jgi:hypothetical protein
MSQAPVALFVYNRPSHTRRTIDALAANLLAEQTPLYIFSDGARNAAASSSVEQVRDLARAAHGFASVRVVERERNFGLARSIIDGVNRVLDGHGRVIVIEDDLLLSPHFLAYMNDGLARYADDERVASIHGYRYPGIETLPETFFLRGADCWGWATWSRAWRHFEPDGTRLLAQLREGRLTRAFDLDASFPFTRMLEDQVAGRNDSWAIRWHASCFLKELLTLYPGRTLVENIGNDATGTHSANTGIFSAAPTAARIEVGPIPVEESSVGRAAFKRFHRSNSNLLSRIRSFSARSLGVRR